VADSEKQSFIDRLGPTLTSGLIIAFLSAASLGAVAIRDLVITTNVELSHLKGEYASLRTELDKFQAPGPRFTKDDGDRHQEQLNDHERRIREQETRPPRLNPAIEKLEDKVEFIQRQQSELCRRLKDCTGYNNGTSGTINPSGTRSGYQGN
jgi:predicted  nucleic acid-binding Zn-ribbon protein